MLSQGDMIRIIQNYEEGFRVIIDMDDENSKYEGLEGSGDTLSEALEDLATSVEIINER